MLTVMKKNSALPSWSPLGHLQRKRSYSRQYSPPRACLEIAFRQLCVPLCGKFGPDEGSVAGYVDRIGTKYTAKWGGPCPKGYLWWIP
ncbi:hypothetical protein DW886_28050 [Enterocloster aldenensis]|nr:hypothetical protein DW886_28050 [Enterocloster aldenensis]